MSRIASTPIVIPEAVDVTVDGRKVTVKGKNGTMDWEVREDVGVKIDGGELVVKRPSSR